LLKKSDGFEMSERKESSWGASRINRSVEGWFLNQTCVAPWVEYLFQEEGEVWSAATLAFSSGAREADVVA
jgi:hypothetical protein